MTEDLGRLVEAAEGQAPSPEFVARLRSQIIAETEGLVASNLSGDTTDDEITVVLDLESAQLARRPSRRRQLIGAAATAAVAALVFIGVFIFTNDNDRDVSELDMVDTPDAPESEVGQGAAEAPITAGNTFFDTGTYRIDTLGTPFTFSVEQATGVLINENAVVMITDLTSRNADDRTLTLRRTSLLPDPTNPTAQIDRSAGWTASDLSGWVDRLSDDVIVGEPVQATVGGLDATFVELEFPCVDANCSPVNPLSTNDLAMFTSGSKYRLWLVDQGAEDPIVVTIAIDDAQDVAWLDVADVLLETLEFGATEPNPVRLASIGQAVVDVFDGISLELSDEVVVVEPFAGFARLLPTGIRGDVELLTRPLDVDGVEVTQTERLLEIFRDEAVELTELDAITVDGIPARSFGVVSGSGANITLKTRNDDLVRAEFGWVAPFVGHVWMVEHPERGLLIVSAESWTGPDEVDALRTWTEDLLGSLKFEER